MEASKIMSEVELYMWEIINLYETPPVPPISLTSLVKACEVVNLWSLQNNVHFRNGKNNENIQFKKLQARFMLIIVREFFKIKNERPEEYIENYENALKLLHLQQKYNWHVEETFKISSKERIEPAQKIIRSSRKTKKRKKKSPDFRPWEQVLNLVPQSSGKKHHTSHSNIHNIHPRPFDLYTGPRHPNDPFPEIKDQKRRNRSRK